MHKVSGRRSGKTIAQREKAVAEFVRLLKLGLGVEAVNYPGALLIFPADRIDTNLRTFYGPKPQSPVEVLS